MIGKLEKARRYSTERERFKFNSFTVTMEGTNNSHTIRYVDGNWNCDCDFFLSRGRCSHTMALEIILESMIEVHQEA